MSAQTTLFSAESTESPPREDAPLAEKLRPHGWDDYRGLAEIDPALTAFLRAGQGRPPSLIIWGPPGSGKTTLAKLIGRTFRCRFVEVSAVMVGVKEVRDIVAEAREHTVPTVLFVDEIHRFNKAQQDAFLPHIENGTIVLIGATTENPSFSLTSALLSRARVVVLRGLPPESLRAIAERGAAMLGVSIEGDAHEILARYAGGDARKLLNLVERVVLLTPAGEGRTLITVGRLTEILCDAPSALYDRSGEEHYNTISAFIKSMRGSDPDAALFWGMRMLEAGEDPRFIIRRMMIFASEDIGNADPRALELAVATSYAFEQVGLPEGRIPIAQCITYLATAPKSNRSYAAMHKALAAVRRHAAVTVPLHLRNAPTKLMKNLGYGSEYEYPHDATEGYVAGIQYLPDECREASFYVPSERGYEKNISERLAILKAREKGKE